MIFGRKTRQKKAISILLCGSSPGCGVTTLALGIANYYSSYEKRRVCYVEFREESKLIHLGKEGILAKGVPGVRIQGVDIFLASYQDMEDLRKCPYDVYIIDADSQWSVFWEHVEWIFRCDKILVLGVYRPWKYREVQCFMKQLIQHTIEIKSGDFYGTNVDREGSERFYQEFHKKVQSCPVIDNPFRLNRKERQWIGDLLINLL